MDDCASSDDTTDCERLAIEVARCESASRERREQRREEKKRRREGKTEEREEEEEEEERREEKILEDSRWRKASQ